MDITFGELRVRQTKISTATKDVRSKLDLLSRWDLGPVTDYLVDSTGRPRRAILRLEDHYRAFIALVLLQPEKPYGMGGDLDTYWHAHLLHTKDYAAMCESVVGFFIHHAPASSSVVAADYSDTASDLKDVFDGIGPRFLFDDLNCSKSCGKQCGRDVSRPRIGM
jgi:hypothetical protein